MKVIPNFATGGVNSELSLPGSLGLPRKLDLSRSVASPQNYIRVNSTGEGARA